MLVLSNLYIDVVAIYEGIVFLIFCIAAVLLSEYAAYKLLLRKQRRYKAILTVLYTNAASSIIGFILVESVADFALHISSEGLLYHIVLFLVMFVITWLIEFIAVYPLRKKLDVQNPFVTVGAANLASYIVLAVMNIFYFLFEYYGNR